MGKKGKKGVPEPKINRWMIVVGAILIQLCLGAIYAWSVFTDPLVAPLPNNDFEDVVADPANGINMVVDGELAVGADETITLTFTKGGDPLEDLSNVSVRLILKDNEENVINSDKIIPYIGIVYEEGDPIEVIPSYDEIKINGNVASFPVKVKKSGSWHMEVTTISGNSTSEVTSNFEIMQNVGTGKYGFSKTESQMIFAAGLFTFALFTIIGGRLSKKFGPRKMAIAGGIVLGAGYCLASLVGGNFFLMLICIGIFGGAGIGLAYVVPIAVGVKWFPDKKGMISGLAVAGFGFGAMLWMKLGSGFNFGSIKLTPDWNGLIGQFGVSGVFLIYGLIFAGAVILGGFIMQNPPEGWLPKGWKPPEATTDKATGNVEFTEKQMRKTPQYWMLFFMFMVGAGAGLMVIGVIKLFGKYALVESGEDAVLALSIAGTSWAFFGSMANGIGRIAWGMISDKIGRKMAFVAMFGLQGLTMLAFFFMGGNEYLLYVGAALIGFNFGGNFALFPAATADFFGNKSVGLNYGWVFLSYGFGGIIGPIFGGVMGDNEAWLWAFVPAGILLLVCAGIAFMLKPPKAPGAVEDAEDDDEVIDDDEDEDDEEEEPEPPKKKKSGKKKKK